MRKRFLVFLLIGTVLFTVACGKTNVPVASTVVSESEVSVSEDNQKPEEPSVEVSVSEEVTEVTENDGISVNEENFYKIGDIDGDGTEDRLVWREIDNPGVISPHEFGLVMNEELIWEHRDELMCEPGTFTWVDLDNDGEDELFFTFFPYVNSMPLIEYAVVKKTDNGWKSLEVYEGENCLDNKFPLKGIYYDGCVIAISCDGFDKIINFDANSHYEKQYAYYAESEWATMEQEFYSGMLNGSAFNEGEECLDVTAWGIWDVYTDEFEGKNCLIAEHGMSGKGWGKYDIIGTAKVYFNYDSEGKISIVDLEFAEDE